MKSAAANRENSEMQADKRGYLEESFRLFHLRDRSEKEIPYHYHDFHKVILFLGGDVLYRIEGRSYRLKEGDLILVPEGAIHQPVISTKADYSRIIFWIRSEYIGAKNIDQGFRICKNKNEYLLSKERYDSTILMPMISNLEQAMGRKDYGSEVLSEAIFLQMMVMISRWFIQSESAMDKLSPPIDETVNNILLYINSHLSEDLSTNRLSEQFYLSKSWMMHQFKAETGYTIHQYILQKRLGRAAKLIIDGENAETAAMACGFSDYSTFLRAFRKIYGVSPREFARRKRTVNRTWQDMNTDATAISYME